MQKQSLKKDKEARKPFIKPFLQSFARKKSRAYSVAQQKLMDEFYPTIRIKEDLSNFEELTKNYKKINLEIGFGAGEHLVYQATKNPNTLFIGAEVYLNGVASCVQEIDKLGLKNVIFFDQDSRILLKNTENRVFDVIYLLFADPWPKKRHHKRRLINQETLLLLHKSLKTNGFIRLATDHADYFEWMVDVCKNQNLFDFDIVPQPKDHLVTRYQQKGLDEGRDSQFIHMRKK